MKTKLLFVALISIMIASCNLDTITSNKIALSGIRITPKTLMVPAGTTVTWVNNEAVTHSVTSNTGLFDSGNLTKGMTFKYTFETPGTYTYHSVNNSGATGKIVVVAITNYGPGVAY